MRILMISLDEEILQENSASQRRHLEYGKICGGLDIIVLNKMGGTDAKFFISTAGQVSEQKNVKIYGTAGKNKITRFFNAYKKARQLVCENKIDLVTTQDAAFTGLIGYFLKEKYGTKLNIQIHGAEEKLFNKILFKMVRGKIIKSADSIRVVSERLKLWIIKKYAIDESLIFKIPVLQNNDDAKLKIEKNKDHDINNLQAQSAISPFNFTLLTVGRIVKVKNIGLQIDALGEVLKFYPKVGLIILGEGSQRKQLEEKVQQMGLEKHVIWAGWQENLLRYYENADLFLLTSNHEGWGRVVIEAMSAGCPVIMTDVGCAGEIVKNGENGIIIPINNKNYLVSSIMEMLSQPAKRKKIAEKAKESARNFNELSSIDLYKRMWEKTVNL